LVHWLGVWLGTLVPWLGVWLVHWLGVWLGVWLVPWLGVWLGVWLVPWLVPSCVEDPRSLQGLGVWLGVWLVPWLVPHSTRILYTSYSSCTSSYPPDKMPFSENKSSSFSIGFYHNTGISLQLVQQLLVLELVLMGLL